METHENIKFLRERMGLSQESLAEKVGYKDRSSIAKIEAGSVDLSQSKIAAFAKALNVTPAQLMGISDDSFQSAIPPGFSPIPETSRVPRIGRIACGQPITSEENIEDYDDVLSSWHADFTLVCSGDSMLPKIEDGDIVAIRKQPEVENGQIAAVRIDGEATLKQVFYRDGYLELRPLNSEYESLIYIGEKMEGVSIEGKAVGLCRNL